MTQDNRQDRNNAGSGRGSRAAEGRRGLAAELKQLLVSARGEIRRYLALDGLMITLIIIGSVFWLAAAMDYLPVRVGSSETPRWVRTAWLIIMGCGVAWALVWRLGRRLVVPMRDRNLAVLLERRFPELGNEVVTAVELVESPPPDVSLPEAYAAMLDRVHASAVDRAGQVDPSKLLDWRPIYRLGAACGALCLLTLVVTLISPSWMRLWSKRLFALSDEAWPRKALLRADGIQLQLPPFTGQLAADRINIPFEDKLVHVPRGGSVVLQVSADTKAISVPELCTLFYRTEEGARGRANLRRLGKPASGWQQFILDGPPLYGLLENLEFDVIGSDARLDDFRLQVVDPTVITDMRLRIRYPQYLLTGPANRPTEEVVAYRSGLRIPEGAEVTLLGTSGDPLREVQYVVRVAESRTASSRSSSNDRITSSDREFKIETVTPGGVEFAIPLGIVHDNAVVEIRTIDQYGLTSDQIPRYALTVAEDATPEVDTKLVGIGTAVTPKAIIPLRGSAVDDYDLARVWTTVVVNEMPPVELDCPVDSEGKVETNIDLLQLAETRGMKFPTGSTLGMGTSAADYYDLQGRKHIGNGQPIQLAIVAEDKLIVMLDRQELELRQRLEQIISELKQLRTALVEQSGSAAPAGALHDKGKASPSDSFVTYQPPTDAAGDDEPNTAGEDPEQARRLAVLRAQQSVLQADKSQQELTGIAGRVEDIRLQLVNNRIDSVDRQARLKDKVFEPLNAALGKEMEDLRRALSQLQTAAMSPVGGREQALAAAAADDRLLEALDSVVSNMMDLESFNEIVDLFRQMVEDQERLLKETKEQQKALLRKQLDLE
ncbi:MAG: hypothetical protein U0892_23080 [Pirellulales bacterium]